MLLPLTIFKGYCLNASDGSIGEAGDFYFNGSDWTICYLVGRIRRWFDGRSVLIPTYFLDRANKDKKAISVTLTRSEIRRLPPAKLQKPISERERNKRSEELELARSLGRLPTAQDASAPRQGAASSAQRTGENRDLRSCRELLSGFRLRVRRGKIGFVEDLIIDDQEWCLRYIVIRTGLVYSGTMVLLPSHFIEDVSFEERQIVVSLPRWVIEQAPRYDSGMPIDADYERRVRDHYGEVVASRA